MATMVLCLALLCLYSLTPASESVTADRRSEEVYEKYVLHDETGGGRSHLFSQCIADANTVEGSLYSIVVPGDEAYVRFVPKEKMEFEWTIVDLGDGKGAIECAQKAHELNAHMFKFDGSCSVAPASSSYDPKSEQGCDGDATEVVYIISRPLNVIDGEVVPVGESRGCLYSSPEGMRYGGEEEHLVSEVQLPPPDVCSPTADKGYHLVADCSLDKMNFCEAQARCEARGVPMASKSFYDELAPYEDWTSIPSDVVAAVANVNFRAWLNIQLINDTWQWMPDMVVMQESEFSRVVKAGEHCGYIFVEYFEDIGGINAVDCTTPYFCVYCHDPNSLLPQC